MSETETKPKEHIISVDGENNVGAKRFQFLLAAAERAAGAFKQGYYLEAITLTESLLATRLESRLTWVREKQGTSEAVRFSTLGRLCKELLSKDAEKAPDWTAFQVPIQKIRKWTNQRNEALHEMAKLDREDGPGFHKKYVR